MKALAAVIKSTGVAVSVLVSLPAIAQDHAPEKADPAAAAVSPQGDILNRVYKISIPSQKLSAALIELSRQSGTQILMPGGALSEIDSKELVDELSIKDALERLLADTGYRFHAAGPSTISIDAPALPDASVASPVDMPGPESKFVQDADSIPVAAPDVVAKPEATDKSGKEGSGLQRLDDVMVTATKREKSARDIPVSITALKGEDLEKIGARDVKDYLMLVPGVTMVDGQLGEASGRNFTVRGVGPSDASGLGNQTMGQFLGDVPLTDPFGNFGAPDLDPYDLKTIEVLRGPQGTTFGASALNGAFRYVPNDPEFDKWQARGFVERTKIWYGGANETYGLGANAPIGSEAAVRVSGILQNVPGLYDNIQRGIPDADSGRKWSARAALRWEPLDKLSIHVMALKQQSHKNDVLQADNGQGNFSNDRQPGPSTIDFGFSAVNLDMRYNFDAWGTLVLQSNWQQKTSIGNVDSGIAQAGELGIETLRADFNYRTRGNSQELRLVSPDGGRWDWIAGIFRRDYQADILAHETAEGATAITLNINPLIAREAALFGELTRRLGDSWEVTLGARRYTTSLNGLYDTDALTQTTIKKNQIHQDANDINPKASLVYKPSHDFMAYAVLARGFQFGGINNPLINPPVSNPLTGATIPYSYGSSVLWNREVGVRTDWLDRTLRADLALYDILWEKAQLEQYTGGKVSNNGFIDNVGSVTSLGAEASLSWLTPLPGLSVNIVGSYVQARTSQAYQIDSEVVPKGTDLPAVPHVQTATTLAYNTEVGSWAGGASATYAQWGQAWSDLNHTYSIFDFGTLGLNFSAARPDITGQPTLTLNVANILDSRGVVGRNTQGLSLGVGGSAESWTYIRPRTISLRLSAEFN